MKSRRVSLSPRHGRHDGPFEHVSNPWLFRWLPGAVKSNGMRTTLLLLLVSVASFGQSAAKKPFDVWALHRLVRISDAQLSPDGATVAFVGTRVSLSSNSTEKQIYVVPLAGGTENQLTFDGKSNARPRWSPDSTQIAYISDKGGSRQVWIMDADGSRPRQITDFAAEASGLLFSPDGQHLVFTSRVFPGLRRRQRLQPPAAGAAQGKPSSGAALRRATLPPLGSMG